MTEENKEDTTQEDTPPTVREQLEWIVFFHEDVRAFYVAMFPQLDTTEEQEEEFLNQLNEEELFDKFYYRMAEAYGGEENLGKVIKGLNAFWDVCADSFEVVPNELDEWLHERDKTKLH